MLLDIEFFESISNHWTGSKSFFWTSSLCCFWSSTSVHRIAIAVHSTVKENLKNNKIEDSLDKVALAFAQLIDDYESRKRDEFGRSPFFFGESMSFLNSFFIGLEGDLGRFVDRVKESVEALQESVKILSLGLDYCRYAKFRLLTPIVLRMLGGSYHIQRIQRNSKGAPTKEDVQFCIDFIIESAIALQEFDFSLQK